MSFVELLSKFPIRDGIYATIVVFVIYAILKGLLVTRERLTDVMAQRDRWEAAYMKSEEARLEEAIQNGQMVDSLKAIEHFMAEFKSFATSHEEEGR